MTCPMLASSQTIVSDALFYLLAAISAGSAIGVVASRNIVRTAVFLLFTLAGVAGLYFLLNAEFLAAAQLVIYAGGTLILIIFGVMLTSKSPYSRFEPGRIEVVIAVLAGAIVLIALCGAIISAARAGVFPAQPLISENGYPINALGQALLGDFLLPFELASVLLLIVMIGAAFLAKGRRHNQEQPPEIHP